MGTPAELSAWLKDLSVGWRPDRREKAHEIAAILDAKVERADRPAWEYLDLCPDSDAGYSAMLREVGEEGWEAVCSWVEEIQPGTGDAPRRINHILYKRPA